MGSAVRVPNSPVHHSSRNAVLATTKRGVVYITQSMVRNVCLVLKLPSRKIHLPGRPLPIFFISQDCVWYFDTSEKTGAVDWSTPHVLFENRAVVDFNTDPKSGEMDKTQGCLIVLCKNEFVSAPSHRIVDSVILFIVLLQPSYSVRCGVSVLLSPEARGLHEHELPR